MQETKKFFEILAQFDTAMLVTRTQQGQLRARPMAIVKNDGQGEVWFLTRLDSAKAAEMGAEPHVCLTMQDKSKALSVSGSSRLVRDRAKLDEVWKDTYKIWAPQGKDDPELVIVVVRLEQGEYWDNEGVGRLEFLFEAAKAFATGTTMKKPSEELHGRARLS
jgi:general stress protein 26